MATKKQIQADLQKQAVKSKGELKKIQSEMDAETIAVIQELAKNAGLNVDISIDDKREATVSEAEIEKQKQIALRYKKKEAFIKKSPYYPEFKKKLISERQLVFLTVYEKNQGNITESCRIAKIKLTTYKNWKVKNVYFKELFNSIDEVLVDEAVIALKSNVNKGKEKSVFRVLDTLGKSRGLSIINEEELEDEMNEINTINLNSDEEDKKIELTVEEYREFRRLQNNQKTED